MKTLLAFVLTLSMTSAFAANNVNDRATTGSPATTGSTTGTYGSEAPPENDTIGTSQSSTTTTRESSMRNTRRTVPNANCIDRTGRTFTSTDAGFSACRASMKK